LRLEKGFLPSLLFFPAVSSPSNQLLLPTQKPHEPIIYQKDISQGIRKDSYFSQYFLPFHLIA